MNPRAGAHLYEHKLSYFSVPKCACTSLKHFFFTIENGFAFRDYQANGRPMHIHNAVYQSDAFEAYPHKRIADHWKIAVVRDPLERVLSCFSNRVLHHRELERIELSEEDRERGLTREPDLTTFVKNLERYMDIAPTIAHHAGSLTHYLGRDAAYFDRIYSMDELGALVDEVAARVGAVPELQSLQRGGPKFRVSDLALAEQDHLRRLYAEDYDIFGKFLGQPTGDVVSGRVVGGE